MATANNLASILTSKSSHDSFHSTSSNHHSSADAIIPHSEAPDDAALQLHDVETFLNEPSTIALLATSASSKKRKTPAGSGSSSAEPIQLGSPKTSHNVSLLYIECQQRGIDPEFEFEGDQDGFSSSVTISGKTFSSDQLFATKKEAKENLAGKALPFVKAMECHQKVAAGPQENWIGKLLGEAACPHSPDTCRRFAQLTLESRIRIPQRFLSHQGSYIHRVCSTGYSFCLYLPNPKPSHTFRRQRDPLPK